jgi:Tfp pilus assembly protein PilX
MMILNRVRASRDDGVVLVMVLWTTGILVLLSAIMVSSAVSLQRNARKDQTWQASLAAAQAGVDDYISRLNTDGNYWRYGNPANSYTNNASATLPTGTNANPALSTWSNVPGTSRAQFRYEVNSSSYISQGIIKLRSTGRAGKSTRTVETTIRRRGFLDYLYFTNFETLDPAAYPTSQSSLTRAQADTQCRTWWYSGRSFTTGKSVPSANCVDINFSSGDVVNGPLHTNDAFLVCGNPQFKGPTTSSWQTTGTRYRVNTGCSGGPPTFARSGDPAFNGILTLPPNNANIQREVDPAFTATPGCLYAGPTKIVFNNTGTMNVTSPWTKDKTRCATGNNVPIPANGVIYVQTVPTTPSAPNYWAPGAAGTPSCASSGNPIGYPQNGDDSSYPCQAGDVFVEGIMKGQATIASENDIYVTGDLSYQGGVTGGSATDIVGLVANNYVYVYHPVNCNSSGGSCTNVSYSHTDTTSGGSTNISNTTFSNPIIQAAVLSVQHSFIVQNYTLGAQLGNISLTGAIAQTFRGPVGLIGSTGYLKNYVYDARLKYMSPPHFLDPVQSAFQVTTSAEPAPVFKYNAP